MKALLILPILAVICAGASKAGCSSDTMFICTAIIIGGWMANND